MLVVLLVHPEESRRQALAASLREAGYAVIDVAGASDAPDTPRPDAWVVSGDLTAREQRALSPTEAPIVDTGDAEVRAALAERASRDRPPLALGIGSIDLRRRTVFRDGGAIELTDKEVALVAWLAGQAGRTVSRGDLLVHVWGYRADTRTRTVDVTVRRLREKIERDPSAPEHLITIRGEGYRLDLDSPRSPEAPSGVFGRSADLAAIEAALQAAPVVTLLGPPGIGKTTLATAVATAHDAPLVLLETCRSQDEVAAAVAAALEIPPQRAGDLGRALATRGDTLMVLDNAEQVDRAVARALSEWRQQAPGARFLVTSRNRLRLPEERVVDLGPLGDDDALELLLRRARKRRSEWASSETGMDAARQVVALLQGVPLALELAAARARLLPPADLLSRLQRSLGLLRDGELVDRQSTMTGAVQWSWDLLGRTGRAALAQLSVFRGGFDLDAVEAVLDLGEEGDALFAVESLVDHSLIGVLESEGRARYALLPWIAAFAAARLEDDGVRLRHAQHYTAWAGAARRAADGPDGFAAMEALRLERPNVIAALEWAVDHDFEALPTLATALYPTWDYHGTSKGDLALFLRAAGDHNEALWIGSMLLVQHLRFDEATALAKRALDGAREPIDTLRGWHGIAKAAIERDAWDTAADAFERALAVDVEAAPERIRALAEYAVVLRRRGELSAARAKLEEAVALADRRQVVTIGSGARGILASVLLRERRHAQSLALAKGLRDVHAAHGGRASIAAFTGMVGVNLRMSGRSAEALAPLEEAAALVLRDGPTRLLGHFQGHRARALWGLARFEEALSQSEAALATVRAAGSRLGEAITQHTRSDTLRELGDYEGAAEAARASAAIATELGVDDIVFEAAESLGLTLLAAGDLDGGAAVFSDPAGGASSGAPIRLRGWWAWTRLRDDPVRAREVLATLLDAGAPDSPDTAPEGALRCWYAAALYATGDRGGAARALDRARKLLANGWHPPATEALIAYGGLVGPVMRETGVFVETRLAAALVRDLRTAS